MTMTQPQPHLEGCHHCGLLQEVPSLEIGYQASCGRCGSLLFKRTKDSIQVTLALAITGLIFFWITHAYPLLLIEVEGLAQDMNLLASVGYFFEHEMYVLSMLVLITCILVPLFQLIALIYLLLPMVRGQLAPYSAWVFRLVHTMMPWGMIEVFLLGLLVSMIKLNKLATLVPGWSLWACITLIIIMTTMFSVLNPKDVWKRIPFLREWIPASYHQVHFSCHTCHLTFASIQGEHGGHEHCPRCNAKVYHRKPMSFQRTTALVIGASLLYIPANLLPITQAVFVGSEQADTIMSGVVFFMFSGSWHIALVIFIASVIIPFAKLLLLGYLLFSVRYNVKSSPRVRTRLYCWTEVVGRWSMIDVYVVMILVALVQLKPFAVINAGPGVIYFATVVVMTMIAAECFDARLLWDQKESS